jgi:hypothetical protein
MNPVIFGSFFGGCLHAGLRRPSRHTGVQPANRQFVLVITRLPGSAQRRYQDCVPQDRALQANRISSNRSLRLNHSPPLRALGLAGPAGRARRPLGGPGG